MGGEKAGPVLRHYLRRTGLIHWIFDVQEGMQRNATTQRKERSVRC